MHTTKTASWQFLLSLPLFFGRYSELQINVEKKLQKLFVWVVFYILGSIFTSVLDKSDIVFFKRYHPLPLRDSNSQSLATQAETIPLDHAAKLGRKKINKLYSKALPVFS
jgi:hypothetical protein